MSKDNKPISWFTSKGRHIPIFEGQSKEEAFNNAFKKEISKKEEVLAKVEQLKKEKEMKKEPELEPKPTPKQENESQEIESNENKKIKKEQVKTPQKKEKKKKTQWDKFIEALLRRMIARLAKPPKNDFDNEEEIKYGNFIGNIYDFIDVFEEPNDELTSDFIEIDKFSNITNDFNMKGDFTVLHGPLTRAGAFEYFKDGKKVILHKDWNNILNVHKKQSYYPLKATVDIGAHQAEILGYATNWEPNHEEKRMYGDVVLFSDINNLTDLLDPKTGYEVSIGFKDDVDDNNIQWIEYIDHLAMSLKNKDKGRCHTAGGLPCFVKKK